MTERNMAVCEGDGAAAATEWGKWNMDAREVDWA